MTIILSGQSSASPRIGYDNLLASDLATVTASSEASGYEVENAYDWRLYDWWKPATTGTHYITATFASAQAADYFAVFGHNLHTYSASVQLQYSTDAGATWNDATAAQAPTTGKVIFVGFTSISAAQWRVKLVSASGPASLGMVAFGAALVFPKNVQPSGFKPPNLARKNEYLNNKGDTGAFLGRSLIRRSAETDIQFNLMDPDWVRETWDVFIQHAERKPFFFSWDYSSHPDEAAFCWVEDDIQPPEYVNPVGYMRVSLPMVCLTEL